MWVVDRQTTTWSDSPSSDEGGAVASDSSIHGTTTAGNALKTSSSVAVCIVRTKTSIGVVSQGASPPYPMVVSVCITTCSDRSSDRGSFSNTCMPTEYRTVKASIDDRRTMT